ncbi:GntR family transcriptional regulator [Robbsia andropogonis]|uniref:GntR family transcriptional regulator n=1 Tax=Robbsia andropogonis TaxID=28092 RepID=UPI000466296F|nr:GntR family transcriptional regulator [Robbsia andropogonis]MCP1116877.1 GntR family transcriptional regulator [Robbsia andropogonis]MCP1126444.1 GntR family transcriptional regulator [Robbsia andropogonis]
MAGADTANVKQPKRSALRQTTLMETVYQEILRRLQRGQISPDDRVLDYEIAKEFDCTRMPVRQALLRLVNEGYLVGSTRGFMTPVLSAEDVREIFEVRRLLEPSAVASTIPVLHDVQRAGLATACRDARRAYERADVALMSEANVAFRGIWLEGVTNSRLKSTILRWSDHSQQVRRVTMQKPGTMKLIADGLQAILKAFNDRDTVQARAAVLAFIDDAERQYFLTTEENDAARNAQALLR